MPDVFLSYARDDRNSAARFHDALVRHKWTVWQDIVDLRPGERWEDVIEQQLTDASAVLVLWSKHAANSRWVRNEAALALEQGKLVAVSLDGYMPNLSMRDIQFENMSNWDGKSAEHPGFVKILDRIGKLLETRGASGQGQRTHVVAPPGVPWWREKRQISIAAGAAIAIVLVAVIVFTISMSRRETPSLAKDGSANPPPIERTDGGASGGGAAADGSVTPQPPNITGGGGATTKKPETPGKPSGSPATKIAKRDDPSAASTPVSTAAAATAAPAAPPAPERGCATLMTASRNQSGVAQVFFDLGKCHYDEGRFNDAVAAYNSAIELNNHHPKYFEALGLAKWKNNQPMQGIKDLTSAIEMSELTDSDRYSLFESRGRIHLANRDYQSAMDDYTHATELNKKSISAWLGLAEAAGKNRSDAIAESAKSHADKLQADKQP